MKLRHEGELRVIHEDANKQQLDRIESLLRHLVEQGEDTVAKIEDVNAKIAEVKQQIADEKAEVAAAIQALKDQIAAGGTITEAQLDSVLAGVGDIGAGVKDIHA